MDYDLELAPYVKSLTGRERFDEDLMALSEHNKREAEFYENRRKEREAESKHPGVKTYHVDEEEEERRRKLAFGLL